MKYLPLLLTAALGLGLTGCSTVDMDAQGESQAVYQVGEFRMVVNATAPATAAATQKAFKSLDLYEVKTEIGTYEASLQARSRDDYKVYVKIAEVNSKQTMVKIRWGVTGSKVNSRDLFDMIERNLR